MLRSRVSNLLNKQPIEFLKNLPIEIGEEAPILSLTAEEGTWIKLSDFRGHLNVVLVFFRSLKDDSTDNYLKALDDALEQFEELDTVVFAVTHHKTDVLRDYRLRHGLEQHLLYDPFALCARKFHTSGRIRPICKPNVVIVGKDGLIKKSQKGWIPIEQLLSLIAEIEGTKPPEKETTKEFTGVRDPGAPAASVTQISALQAQEMLAAEDSPYILLDVRTETEFQSFHPQGAINIPLDEMPHRYQELEQNTDIICVSQTGGQSDAAAEFLTSVGMSDVFNVTDGIAAWT